MPKQIQVSKWLSLLKLAKDWWPVGLAIGGAILTFALLPQKVVAVEKKLEKVESRQQTIEQYIVSLEEQKKAQADRIKNAPAGWKWSESDQKYVPIKK